MLDPLVPGSPLYRDDAFPPSPRTEVALAWSELSLYLPDGRCLQLELDGARHSVGDATARRRFVRMMSIEARQAAVTLITPPDRGAIAPRVAHLPAAPDDAAVLEAGVWEQLADWVASSGRLAGRTVEELARLASIATAPFAVVIGGVAAGVARDLARMASGPCARRRRRAASGCARCSSPPARRRAPRTRWWPRSPPAPTDARGRPRTAADAAGRRRTPPAGRRQAGVSCRSACARRGP
ncbi:MAG: hypothetical protein HS111_32775 [Kofleriaceae bacterium]|nr:hypothetical protein [Kofleriaceae bacterium]